MAQFGVIPLLRTRKSGEPQQTWSLDRHPSTVAVFRAKCTGRSSSLGANKGRLSSEDPSVTFLVSQANKYAHRINPTMAQNRICFSRLFHRMPLVPRLDPRALSRPLRKPEVALAPRKNAPRILDIFASIFEEIRNQTRVGGVVGFYFWQPLGAPAHELSCGSQLTGRSPKQATWKAKLVRGFAALTARVHGEKTRIATGAGGCFWI